MQPDLHQHMLSLYSQISLKRHLLKGPAGLLFNSITERRVSPDVQTITGPHLMPGACRTIAGTSGQQ